MPGLIKTFIVEGKNYTNFCNFLLNDQSGLISKFVDLSSNYPNTARIYSSPIEAFNLSAYETKLNGLAKESDIDVYSDNFAKYGQS